MHAVDPDVGNGPTLTRKPRLAASRPGAIVMPKMSGPFPSPQTAERIRQEFLDSLPIPVAIIELRIAAATASEARVITANEGFRRLCGTYELFPPVAMAQLPLFAPGRLGKAIESFLLGEASLEEFEWRDGTAIGGRHFTVRLGMVHAPCPEDRHCVISLVDRTAEIETGRSLRAEMLHDSLTGLPNRMAFIEAIENVMAAPRDPAGSDIASPYWAGGAYAVLVVDLTRFSRVNECIGSIAGDELIITVARRLLSALRAGDRLARIGGDEFAVLLRLVDGPGDALHAARRIHDALLSPFRLSDLEIRVDCAVGCAYLGEGGSYSEEFVRNAQLALKRAKASGKVEVYQPGEAIQARARFSMETELRRAIERDELTLAYQPLIDLVSGKVASFESLARWTHSERGPISPVEFIPVAEESGLIVPLGRWALDRALRTLGQWDALNGSAVPIRMGVNISAIQIARDDVPAMVTEALERTGISGDRLTLELTESAIISDPERAALVMLALKDLGARIAMDDFGTGYSSLAYLQRLPIDMLKIDRSFVTNMLANRDSVAIVRAVLSLADALGMDTTAEGVETIELAQTLGALGCTHGQGYHFARPLSAVAAYQYLVDRNG